MCIRDSDYRDRHPDESAEQYGARLVQELAAAIDEVGGHHVIAFVAETVVGATAGALTPVPGYLAVACTAALAVQCVIARDGLLQAVQRQGQGLRERLQAAFGAHPQVGDIRGRKTPFDPTLKPDAQVRREAMARGLMVYPMGGTLGGLLVPLIAVHMFVFYFGLMADITPPMGLASFAAAAIARSDPIKTGITAFNYSMRTAILPFLFIFNTQLLLIGIENWAHLLLTITISITAMLVFAAATQGYFLVRSRWYESIALLLVVFALFRPGFFWDELYAPFVEAPAAEFRKLVEAAPAGANKRVWIEGQDINGKDVRKGVLMPLGDAAAARERLRKLGLTVVPLGNEMQIAQVQFGSKADKLGIGQGFRIAGIQKPADRPSKEGCSSPRWRCWA